MHLCFASGMSYLFSLGVCYCFLDTDSWSMLLLSECRFLAYGEYLFLCDRFVSFNRKIKKGVQIKRTKNMRKMKAVARAISKTEKSEEKVLKAKSKKTRIQSAKSLYD